LKLAAEMADAGIMITLESLKRRFPGATEAELKQLLAEAAERRPGDGPGVAGSWPRH